MPTTESATFSLLQIAFLMFVTGACGGVLFTLLSARGVRYPAWMGAAHGLLGLTALGALGLALTQEPPDGASLLRAWWALGVFSAALLGGLTFFRVLRFPNQSLLLPLLHGGLALVGLYLLYPVAFAASSL